MLLSQAENPSRIEHNDLELLVLSALQLCTCYCFRTFFIWTSLVSLVWTKRTPGVLHLKPCTFCYLLFVFFSVLYVLPFICIVVMSCNAVILMLYLTLPLKREFWHATKPGSLIFRL